MADKIEEIRVKVDAIDEQIVELLNDRAALVLKIRAEKKALGQPLHDPERELKVLNKVMSANKGPLNDELMRHVYRHILQHMREFQENE